MKNQKIEASSFFALFTTTLRKAKRSTAVPLVLCLVACPTLRAVTYTYSRTTSNTSGTADQWSAGTSWSGTPISASTTTLTFNGSLAAGTTVFTNNDIAGNFQVNQLNILHAGPGSGSAPSFTISGNPLQFINDGATAPNLTVTTTGTIKPVVTISNNLVLTNATNIVTNSNAALTGLITGATFNKFGGGNLTVTGGTLATPSSVTTFKTFSATTNLSGYLDAGTFSAAIGTLNTNAVVRQTGALLAVGDNGAATLNVTGGSLTAAPTTSTFIGNGASGVGSLNISGGSVSITSTQPVLLGAGFGGATGNGGGTGTLTVSGAGSFSTGVTTGTLQLGAASTFTGSGTINLDGGTFSTLRSFTKGAGTATATVNFNGGTLQTTGNNATLMTGLTNAFVKAGGAVIDTQNFSATIGQDLLTDGVSTGGGLTKNGTGTLTLTGASTYTGATTISSNGGTLILSNNNTTTPRLAATSGITVNNGGKLTLAQSGIASANRINDSATLTLASGTLNTGGLNEGPAGGASGSSAAMGALTLGGTTVIDFTNGNSSNLLFSNLASYSGTLLVDHWTGALGTDSGSSTNDRLLFISDTGLTPAQLSSITFNDDSGAFLGNATQIGFNGYYELVAVPEPSVTLLLIAAGTTLSFRRRRGNR